MSPQIVPEEPPVVTVVDASDDTIALELDGEFDMDAAPELLEHAERALQAGKNLIVNLSDATFIDFMIVHTLFRAEERAAGAGRVLILQFGTDAAVERVLSITGADARLETAPTREQALERIRERKISS